jgi:SAM-dependent methyltransferase
MSRLIQSAAEYYAGKFSEFGATHRGVDWNSTGSQELRFTQLLKVCDLETAFELNDLGCGYGALFDYLKKTSCNAIYNGYDICEEMIRASQQRNESETRARFIAGSKMSAADYTVASGILHVKLEASDEEWLEHAKLIIDEMDRASRKGFAINFLTKYSDADQMRSDLYYADPCYFFDYVKRRYARNVALLHDYGLWEFTLIARKD